MTEKIWKPFPKQEQFLALPDTIFEGGYGGAAGGGKSECLLLLPIIRGFYKHPRFKGIIFRRTYPELEKEIILRSQEFYPACGGKYNDEKKRWTFHPQGSIMQFGHVEYDHDVRKYDTTEYNYMAFDEATSFSEYQYLYLSLTRVRSSVRDLPAIVRSATNPGNVGHGWYRARFVENAPYGTIQLDKKTGLKRIFIQAFATDNPHIDPGYVQRLSALPEAERRAKLDGDWWTFSGQVFDDWREVPMPDEPANATHVVEPFEIPSWWPRLLAIDWGFTAQTCAYWAAISPTNRLYIYREYVVKQTRISSWASDVGRLSQNEEIKNVVMCRSAWQNRGDDKNIAQQFKEYSGLTPFHADNDRISGKLMLQEFLRWRAKPRNKEIVGIYNSDKAAEILRKSGTEAYKEYLGSFEPEKEETNLPILQVFTTCPVLRKTLPLCVYNNDQGGNKEDVAEFDGDDPYDAIRYLVMQAARLLGKDYEGDKRRKVAEVLEEFQQSQDYTRLHRRMELVEATKNRTTMPVRRYHRARLAN